MQMQASNYDVCRCLAYTKLIPFWHSSHFKVPRMHPVTAFYMGPKKDWQQMKSKIQLVETND